MTIEKPKYSPTIKRFMGKALTDAGFDFVNSNARRQTGKCLFNVNRNFDLVSYNFYVFVFLSL